jgi:exodeoxyribonuclease VII small subunit
MTAKKTKETDAGFEASLERLETIVAEMESGELSLEAMIQHFEEGQKLMKLCGRKLNEVEKKIEKLVQDEDGAVSLEPFDDPSDPDAETDEDELF